MYLELRLSATLINTTLTASFSLTFSAFQAFLSKIHPQCSAYNDKSTVNDSRNSVCERRKASPNDHHDRLSLDETATLTDFNSKTIFAVHFIRQIKQTKYSTETTTNQTNHRLLQSKLMQT